MSAQPDPAEATTEPEDQKGQDEAERRPFAAWLTEQRGGSLAADLSESLAEVVNAVLEHGKKGSLTLTLNVAPGPGEGEARVVVIQDEVKAKAPAATPPTAMFFADSRGNLSRRDPRQTEMPLRDASKKDAS